MLTEKIIRLKPVFQDYLWGGVKIRNMLDKHTEGYERIAESWELSTHPDGESRISGGAFDGKTLSEYFDAVGWEESGEYGAKFHCLPVMVKFIDAKENLSIQVHPNDEYALCHEKDHGKNEIWYIVEADENAFVYLGFNRDTTKEEVEQRLKDRTIEEILNKVPVQKGEFYYVPAGTIHAIGAGCLICEIQQTSNLTYRMYDYDRTDKFGKPRELHIEKALEVLNYAKTNIGTLQSRDMMSMEKHIDGLMGRSQRCTMMEYDAEGELTLLLPVARLTFAFAIEGSGTAFTVGESKSIKTGDALMIHGNATRVSGKCKIIFVTI